jgi:3'-phosphoadenosine 5'-phosphosulfate (PAPS) 3'-phosphatase
LLLTIKYTTLIALFKNNPVEAGIVEKPEHYLYSSAKDYV